MPTNWRNPFDPTAILAKEVTLPEFVAEVEEYQSPSVKYKYAKGVTWNDVKVVFYDTAGVYDILNSYKFNVWSPTLGLRSAEDYKATSEITIYQGDDLTPECKWYLYNSWVRGINWSQLTYTSSDVHSVTVTLAYDWAEVTKGT